MKTLILLSVLLIVPLNAMAVDHTVKPSGGDFSTIQACANAMSNGDSCTVFAGTYNEHVSVSAGAVGAYKTFQVNGTDVVTVQSFTLGSHTKLIGNCLSAPSAIGTCGFSITDPSSPGTTCVSAGSSTDVYVANNTLTECGGITMSSSASFIYVQGNTVSWLCRTSSSGTACDGIAVHGNHILVEKNDISHYRLGVNYQGTYGVFRNNTFHDQYETDSGQHTDAFFSEPVTEPSQYHVIEGNTHNNAVGPNAKGMLSQGDACSGNCYNVIIRYNTEEHIDSGIIVDENAGSSTNPGFYNVKAYNNTLVDTNRVGSSGSAIDNNYACHSINPADLNNIYYWPGASPVLNAYAADSVCGNTVFSTFNYGHDLAYCDVSSSSSCPIKGHQYNGGSFQSDPGNVFGFAGQTPTNNPNFVNYSANNFNLTAGSPAIGAGTNLTTVSGSDTGSGTSLIVNDASYFQDGYGLTGVQADCIAVGTVTNTACISSINYSTNTITLATPLTRSNGASVWLFKKSDGAQVLYGTAPDIGAFPFVSSGGGGTPTITATAGTLQNATVNASFGTALTATVKDASNNLLSGVTVTFTAPASGASGTFTGGSTTATATTNGSGVATGPTFTANGTPGTYTVTATVSGVATPANFNLSNTVGTPTSIAASGGASQSAAVNTSFGTAMAATVKDASNNLLSGVAVTFTAPSNGASGTFPGGLTTETVTTNASGVATDPPLTANGTAGSYSVTATVSGVATPANFNLTNTVGTTNGTCTTVTTSWQSQLFTMQTGTFTASFDATPSTSANDSVISLSQNIASDYSQAVKVRFNPTGHIDVWNAAAFGADISLAYSAGNAYHFRLITNIVAHTFSVYVTPPGLGESLIASNYAFLTAQAGDTSLSYFSSVAEVGTVSLCNEVVAGNSGIAATITSTTGTPQNATVNTSFGSPLAATVKDASNNLLSGVTVTFTAPASGASGTFAGGLPTATATTNAGGVATAPTFTANGTPGTYTVTATVSGVATPANFNLTNTVGTPASITASGGASQSVAVYTSFGTALAATVKDASNNLLSGVTVTFTAPASGASGTFTGGLTTAAATTNSSGVATAPTFTANGTPGTYTVTATVSGVATPANFNLTNRTLAVGQIPFNIPNLGATSMIFGGTSGTIGVGHATIQVNPGMAIPAGVAIFGSRETGVLGFGDSGVLVAEAGVPATPLIQTGRIYVEVNGTRDTGLSMTNPGVQDAVVSFSFTNTAGGVFGSGTTTIPAGQQIAQFLDGAPFNGGTPIEGTLTFSSSVPVTVAALRTLVNERGDFLMTTLPVVDLSAAVASSVVRLPQFADGGGWVTSVVLVNPTDNPISGAIQFLDPSGSPWTLTASGQMNSTFSYAIPGKSSFKLVSAGNGTTTQSGSVLVMAAANTAAPTALAIFSYSPAGITVTEAGVPSIAGTAFRMYAEGSGAAGSAGSIQTGVAISNADPGPATVNLELFNSDGTSATATSLTIPANGQVAKFLSDLFPILPPFVGVLRISTSSSGLAVVGLRTRLNERGDFLITTTPPTSESAALSNGQLFFPHLAIGGGYTTQLILFSGSPGPSSSGTLNFDSQSGVPLLLTPQ